MRSNAAGIKVIARKDLLPYLLGPKSSREDQTAFVCAYRTFMTPAELLDHLLERFELLDVKKEDEAARRVLSFLALWGAISFEGDFASRPPLLERVQAWLATHVESAADNNLKALFFRKPGSLGQLNIETSMQLPVPSGTSPMNHKFLDWKASVIADHLCLIAAAMYNKVHAAEFIDLAWQKENREELAPNLTALAARFNALAFWVAATIVFRPPAPRSSVDVIEKWVAVAWDLYKRHNFQSLMSVVSGLNHGAVLRLKQVWAQVNSKTQERFATLDGLQSPIGGYRAYRDHLGHVVAEHSAALASSSTPLVVVPYMPTVLGDLAMQGEGNPALVDGQINFSRVEMVGARVYEALRFQPAHYAALEQDSSLVMYFLSTELSLSEDDLYAESTSREPVAARSATVNRAQRKIFARSVQLLPQASSAPGSASPLAALDRSRFFPAARNRSSSVVHSSPLVVVGGSVSAAAAPSSSTPTRSGSSTPVERSRSGLGSAKLQIMSLNSSIPSTEVLENRALAVKARRRTESPLVRSISWPPKGTPARVSMLDGLRSPPPEPSRASSRAPSGAGSNSASPVRSSRGRPSNQASSREASEEATSAEASPRRRKSAVDDLKLKRPPRKWGMAEVRQWLDAIGLPMYAATLEQNDVTGADLADLTENDLVDLGITKIGHKKLFAAALVDLFGHPSSSGSSTQRLMSNSPRLIESPGRRKGASPPTSPGRLTAAVSPRTARAALNSAVVSPGRLASPSAPPPIEGWYVKFKSKSAVCVREVPRGVTYAGLVAAATDALGIVVKRLSHVDSARESSVLTNDDDVTTLLAAAGPTVTVTVLVNHKSARKIGGRTKSSSVLSK